VGQRIRTESGQDHDEHIRPRIHDPRAVTRRTELLALLDDAVKIPRSTAHEIGLTGGLSNDRRRDPERTESTANEPAELALGRYGERRGHETEQDEPEAEHHRAAPIGAQAFPLWREPSAISAWRESIDRSSVRPGADQAAQVG